MLINPYVDAVTNFIQLIGVSGFFSIVWGILLFVLIIILIILKNKATFAIGIGPFKLKFGNKNKELDLEIIDFILSSQQDNIKKVVELENNSLKRQLKYTEEKLSQLKFLLISSYSSVLSKKLQSGEDVKTHKDYKSYKVLASVLIRELVDKIFKTAFEENHLSDMEESVWETYLFDKSVFVINFISEFMDTIYGEGKLINRNECSDIEKELYPDFKKMIKEIFENIKEMNLQFSKELIKLNEENRRHLLDIYKKNGIMDSNDGSATKF